MSKRIILQIGLILWLSLLTLASAATLTPRLSRNADLATALQNALRGEQVLELVTGDERFLALKLEQRTGTPQGGLLILHDAGQTADWPYLLNQVRTYLPDTGWQTLAIDLPIPATDAVGRVPLNDSTATAAEPADPAERTLARIAAGIAALNDDNLFNIVILGYGEGAYWGSRYLAERMTPEEANGFGLILFDPALSYPQLAAYVADLQIPTLDLYMNDSAFSHEQARLRQGAARRAQHPDYLQVHDALRQPAYGKPAIDRSTRRIWGWLRTHAAGQEATVADDDG